MSAQKVWVFFIVETSPCIRVNVALSPFKETRGPVPALSEMSFPRGLPVLVSLNSIGKHVFFPCGASKCNATIRQYNLMLLRSLYCWNRTSPADISVQGQRGPKRGFPTLRCDAPGGGWRCDAATLRGAGGAATLRRCDAAVGPVTLRRCWRCDAATLE